MKKRILAQKQYYDINKSIFTEGTVREQYSRVWRDNLRYSENNDFMIGQPDFYGFDNDLIWLLSNEEYEESISLNQEQDIREWLDKISLDEGNY